MTIIEIDIQDQNAHSKFLCNILKETKIRKIIKKHPIIIAKNDIEIKVTPLDDQDKITEIIQEIIEITQDQIQDPDILRNLIEHIAHTHQDQDMTMTKKQIDFLDKIATHNYHKEILIPILTLSLHVEIIHDNGIDQDHKHRIQILIDIITHTDHHQDQDSFIIDHDHPHIQDKILKE